MQIHQDCCAPLGANLMDFSDQRITRWTEVGDGIVRALIIGAGTGMGWEPYRQALAVGQLMTQ